jgi:alkanesulfonate monooxygenase SsuD/methylene tetrahydromethanopterin reductase-like flavin-dependent oxidoreductase (luciferase family)
MRIMGQDSMRQKEFQSYARTVRALLDGKNTSYTYGGETNDIQLIHPGQGYYQLEPRIPMHIAGVGPVGQRFAGRIANGLVILGAPNAPNAERALANVREGAQRAGRVLDGFEVTTLTGGCVLRPGEPLTSERVIEDTGAMVTSGLHYMWEVMPEPRRQAPVPAHYQRVWQKYLDFVDSMETPPERRYQQVHLGHCSYLVSEEKQFVVPELIESGSLVGTPDQIVAKIREAEAAGLTQVMLMADERFAPRVIRDFAEQVFPLLEERHELVAP